jgi:hypothetical protein
MPRRRGAAAIGALIALTAGLLAATPAEAAPITTGTTYHVDCKRSSNGDGSESHPWNSVGAVNRHKTFHPGDKILLKRGTTCKGRLHPSGSGNATSQIVLGAYGAGKSLPTINGGGTPQQTGTVQLINQPYWTIQDLHVTNRGTAKETRTYRSGVLVRGFNGRIAGVKIQRLKVDSVVSNLTSSSNDPREFGGITVQTLSDGKPKSGFDGLQILHNSVSKVGRTGILVSNHGYPKMSDRKLRIAYNTVTRPRGDSIVIRGSVGARIDHNRSAYGADLWPCAQCGKITPETADAGIWPAYSKDTLIDHNEVYGEHRLGGDGQGIDADISAVNTVIEYNYLHDNEGGGILFCGSNNTTARFNILENNSNGAFVFIGSIPAAKTKIYNNTVYTSMKNGADVVHLQGNKGGRSIAFYNNLIYNMGWGWYHWPAGYTSSHNTVIGTHGIGEPRGNGTIFDTAILRNPGQGKNGFKSLGGYHPASPKDDPRGIAIPKSVTKDFFGNTINPKSPPRGAAVK